MNSENDKSYQDIENRLREYKKHHFPDKEPQYPVFTDQCLTLDRILAASSLNEDEKKHLEGCEVCQQQVNSFQRVSLRLGQSGPLNKEEGGIVQISAFQYRRVAAIAASILLCVGLAAAATTFLYQKLAALSEAARYRAKMDSLYKISGLEKAMETDCIAVQPNTVLLKANIDTTLVNFLAVTYDAGQSWQTLYAQSPGEIMGMAGPAEILSIQESRTFDPPSAGTKEITVQTRAQYIPEVVAAFPELSESRKTEQTYLFEMTQDGITRLIAAATEEIIPERVLASIGLDKESWELTYSQKAQLVLNSVDNNLVYEFGLPQVGDYVNISHSIPGASPSVPFVSMTGLSIIEIQLKQQGQSPVTAEIKMVDDCGRTAGVSRLLNPGKNIQTLRIPKDSLKGYWGIRNFDFNRVRRLELALARKAVNQAAEGALVINSIHFLGTGQFPESWAAPKLEPSAGISLEANRWTTATSGNNAKITLSNSDAILACELSLMYANDLLPWTNLETQLPPANYSDLTVVEFEILWKGSHSITFEPKLVMTDSNITYGRLILIEPSDQYQTLRIFPQDLKYYWAGSGSENDAKMDLGQLRQLSLGLAAKSPQQAQQGTFMIKTIRFLKQSQ